MPPGPSQKGTGKKGAGAIRQRSRNTTPSATLPTATLPPIETIDVEYLELRVETFRNMTFDDLVDATALNAMIPESKSLDAMIARLHRLQETVDKRSNFCDRTMRILARNRKNARPDEIAAEVKRDDERVRTDDEERERQGNKKKRKLKDTLAPQDANNGMAHLFLSIHTKCYALSLNVSSAS
jgi:transcriptional adapter 3